MSDGLTCGRTVVDADIESVGRELISKGRTDLGNQTPDLNLVRLGEIEDAGDVLARNDKGVAIRDWEGIAQSDARRALSDD